MYEVHTCIYANELFHLPYWKARALKYYSPPLLIHQSDQKYTQMNMNIIHTLLGATVPLFFAAAAVFVLSREKVSIFVIQQRTYFQILVTEFMSNLVWSVKYECE